MLRFTSGRHTHPSVSRTSPCLFYLHQKKQFIFFNVTRIKIKNKEIKRNNPQYVKGGGIYCGGKSRLMFHKGALSSVLHKEIMALSLGHS